MNDAISSNFFVAGGTVPPGSPSYVERSSDRELLDALLEGDFCYVLNSRQMGKSSLAVRTIEKLNDAGVATAFVDLTRIGGATVSVEQWYAGLLIETGRALGLRAEAAAYIREHKDFGPAQRYLSFLHEVALRSIPGPIVVMIDEIDATRSLGFSTDEFFAGIRQLHNARAGDPELRRLTFCLLGAALPSDLIRDARVTPFNVGKRIELRDFTTTEAMPFAHALGAKGEQTILAVLRWTGGHPFLTQALCNELVKEPDSNVDEIVARRYLGARARETDTNLTDVGNRLLGRGDLDDQQKADVLTLFATMRKKGIDDDESNPAAARIKMSGVARLEAGRLSIRNLIYAEAFGREWIADNMPQQELRRQKKAFWLGALRTATIAGIVLTAVTTLAVIALRNERRAQAAEAQARYESYVFSMRTLYPMYQQHNLTGIAAVLETQKEFPNKGWEWVYWSQVATEGDPLDL